MKEEITMSKQEVDLGKLDNPVKRLHRILEEARSKPGNVAIRYVWADALGVERTDVVELYLALAELVRLFHTAKGSVERLKDINRDYYLEPFDNIEVVITDSNLEQTWNKLKDRLDEITMLALQMASNIVSVEEGKTAISEKALQELQSETEDLLEKVLNTDFPSKELKAVLIEHLESIRRAILAYRVSGTEGLRRAVEGALGALFLHQEQVKSAAQRDEKKEGIIRRFASLLADLSQIASFGIQAAQLMGGLPPLLGPGGS
jgi:hypothetical protein